MTERLVGRVSKDDLPCYREGFAQGRIDIAKGAYNDNPDLPADKRDLAAYLRGYRDAQSLS